MMKSRIIINKANNIMYEKILKWFIKSSANPEKVALTIKGLVPLLVFMGIGNVDQLSESLTGVIVALGAIISGMATLWGFARKIAITLGIKIVNK
jgi:hypothetical protein